MAIEFVDATVASTRGSVLQAAVVGQPGLASIFSAEHSTCGGPWLKPTAASTQEETAYDGEQTGSVLAAASAIMALAGCANQPGQTAGVSPASATSAATSASPSGSRPARRPPALNATVSCSTSPVANAPSLSIRRPPPMCPRRGRCRHSRHDGRSVASPWTAPRRRVPSIRSRRGQAGVLRRHSCHRLVDRHLILQCGDPTGSGPAVRATFCNELTGSSSTPPDRRVANAFDTTAQFFIVWAVRRCRPTTPSSGRSTTTLFRSSRRSPLVVFHRMPRRIDRRGEITGLASADEFAMAWATAGLIGVQPCPASEW